MLLGGTLSFLMVIALIWWKKVEALIDKKRAHLDFLRKANPQLNDFYTHQESFLEEDRKRKKYHSVLPSTFYDTVQAEILAKLSFGATMLTFLFIVLQNVIPLFA